MSGKPKYTADPGQLESPAAERLRASGRSVLPWEGEPSEDRRDWHGGKAGLHLSPKRGQAMHHCASLSPEYLCCGVWVLDAVSNCPFDCTYCFLQNYLTDTSISVVSDIPALFADIDARLAQQPWRFFRIGTWELGDSLAMEHLTGTAAELVLGVARRPQMLLELKTKSDNVDGLLHLRHGGRTVVGWTLSPAAVIAAEERGTASLDSRIEAMARVAQAGYLVSVHFDPLVLHPGWQAGYEEVVTKLFAAVPIERVAWVSLGALRFNPEMKKLVARNYPDSQITTPEMVLGGDGKVRYVKPLRRQLFDHVHAALNTAGAQESFVYLCMERWDMWQRVLGWRPRSIGHLDYLITDSLYRRYPGLVPEQPDPLRYEAAWDEPASER